MFSLNTKKYNKYGTVEDVLHDLDIIKAAEELGVSLSNSKSEIICHDATTWETLITALSAALVVSPESVCLLGSPLGDVSSIDACLDDKIHALTTMGAHFTHLSAHDSLILLRHCFAIPKLRYLLCTTPCCLSNCLEQYDSYAPLPALSQTHPWFRMRWPGFKPLYLPGWEV